ncbi:MAG: translesion DNA synthesis-associated protein ImuA [Rhodanobacteraceae bacterium]|nr:MAG: translesion DNA synthesis-associated protein ImuA [Rhodanobacteraceae bacterium]
MHASTSLDTLIRERRIWRGRPAALPPGTQPTGLAALDAALPTGGWPEASLTEILIPADGVGELQLVLPAVARLTQRRRRVAVVAPPYPPYAPAWRAAGVDLCWLTLIATQCEQVAWSMEQCLRSGSCAAVLGWPAGADDTALRRLQVAANTGQALGFAFRDRTALGNASPAALRIEIDVTRARLIVHKCRGGNPPPPIAFAHA